MDSCPCYENFSLPILVLSNSVEVSLHRKAVGMFSKEVTATGCCHRLAARSGVSEKQIVWPTHFCLSVSNTLVSHTRHSLFGSIMPVPARQYTPQEWAITSLSEEAVEYRKAGTVQLSLTQVEASYRQWRFYEDRLLKTRSSKCRKGTSAHLAALFGCTVHMTWRSEVAERTAGLCYGRIQAVFGKSFVIDSQMWWSSVVLGTPCKVRAWGRRATQTVLKVRWWWIQLCRNLDTWASYR
jgi:hypothetical protein